MKINLIYKIYFALFSIVLLIVSCKKQPDFNSNGMLQGHAFYYDSSTSFLPMPLRKQTIYINRGITIDSSFYSTVTDTGGYFSIPYLDNGQYTLYATYFNGKKMFIGKLTTWLLYNGGNDIISFKLSSIQAGNGVIQGHAYYIDSTLSTIPKSLKKATLYLKDSNATIDYVYPVTTDSTGYYIISYLPIGSYNLYGTYYNGAEQFTGEIKNITITATNQNIIDSSFYLTPPKPNSIMNLIFQIKSGGYLSRLPFSIFTSRSLAKVDSIQYALLTAKSDSIGLYFIHNLPTDSFYIVSKITLDTVYTVDTGIRFNSPGITTYKITLYKH